MDQLELAASGYFDGEAEFGRAVHDSRKSIKRVRALLRLVKGEIPPQIFNYEDKTLRATGRAISEIRSAAAVVGSTTLIVDLYGGLLAEGTFQEMIHRLSQRRDIIHLRAIEDPQLVDRIVRTLERAYHRYGGWPTDEESRNIYGHGIRNSFEAIEPGIHSTYGRGRREMVTAYRSGHAEEFHAWRKRAKYLRYQMEFLAPLWPEVVVGMAVTLDRLGEILGEEHDLAELTELIHVRPRPMPRPQGAVIVHRAHHSAKSGAPDRGRGARPSHLRRESDIVPGPFRRVLGEPSTGAQPSTRHPDHLLNGIRRHRPC